MRGGGAALSSAGGRVSTAVGRENRYVRAEKVSRRYVAVTDFCRSPSPRQAILLISRRACLTEKGRTAGLVFRWSPAIATVTVSSENAETAR